MHDYARGLPTLAFIMQSAIQCQEKPIDESLAILNSHAAMVVEVVL